MGDLRFDGRVVVVTGAGAGLGRAYALLFGSRGAKVVVNDLGGGRHGDGKSSSAADAVVEEIKRNGGTAVADYNSVVDGDKVIKTALDNFGRVDVLINNAGILRDKSFARISDQDWDLVHAVHLKGSFKTTQAAFPIFKKQGYGRIIMTSSNSGLYGNFGQANYSAAKMGLVGLANTVAIEGAKSNIHCNVIVPTAASRLTEDILPPDLYAELKPELIAPVVAYLCHESCTENGSIIESAAGWAGKCQIIRSNGSLLRTEVTDGVSVENVRDKWQKVTSMTNAEHLDSIQEATGALMTSLDSLRSGQVKDEEVDVYNFTQKDIILYALGVGASLKNPTELKFLYENDEDFSALPTFFILPAMQAMFTSSKLESAIPGKSVSLAQILHGEQYIEFLGEVPKEGKLFSKNTIAEVLDKGSGAAIVQNIETFDEQGNLLIRNQTVAFVVGAGNFGGPRTGTKAIPCQVKPSRAPDMSLTDKTTIDQAALYRLSGDTNPLHIDPNMAMVAGFKQPILHGLCTLGFSVRLLVRAYAGGDSSLVKACKARFMKPVIPGQTLRVDFWREGNRIHFETSVVETNTVVIGGAYVDLNSVKIMEPINNSVSAPTLESDAVFEFIIEQVKADPNKAKSIGGVFLYKITKNGKEVKQWTMDLKNAKVYEGKPEGKPSTTLTVSDEDFMLLAQGKLQPQAAFMKGKLKVTGNIMLAQKLAPLLKANAKL
ncbi:peroxisomal multifunctional enzyme type 2-like isoform X1 [Tribolium madens]|uniref:peroxisomal multifunctional enzyme type 2-like isoform X1 n=2 Tax=Tribolium madens TaxID=41895 RepID=UPI001CF736FA|nr:peroxisomal multifunctional enzyme type 2-like isoform X1 [Tribolium madens]